MSFIKTILNYIIQAASIAASIYGSWCVASFVMTMVAAFTAWLGATGFLAAVITVIGAVAAFMLALISFVVTIAVISLIIGSIWAFFMFRKMRKEGQTAEEALKQKFDDAVAQAAAEVKAA